MGTYIRNKQPGIFDKLNKAKKYKHTGEIRKDAA